MSDSLQKRLESTQRRLDLYYTAEEAVLSGQEYRMGSRSLRRADLKEIRDTISQLENKSDELKAQINNNGKGSRKTFRVTLRDL